MRKRGFGAGGWAAWVVLAGVLRAQEIPAPPGGGEVFPEWAQVRDAASASALLRPMGGTEAAGYLAGGAVRLPVNFAGTRHERVSWDIPVRADLRRARGIRFDFWCGDLGPFAGFSVYFRSGGGWYHTSFCPERAGVWERVEIDKAGTRIEGQPAGWGSVDMIRLSGWRGGGADTVCALANLGYTGGRPEVLVVRADSCAARAGGEARSLGEYAATVSATLDRLGVVSSQLADTDLAPELLEGVRLVVLPYNPSVPAEAVALLRPFVAGGGKVLACYSLGKGVGELLGLKSAGSVVCEGAPFQGFARVGGGLAAQPAFAPQASWRTTVAEASGEARARVVAVWRDGQGRDTATPAITVTPTGGFVGHVWFQASGGEGAALMRALVGELVPDLWRQAAERAYAEIGAVAGSAGLEALRAQLGRRPARAVREALEAAEGGRREARRLLGDGRWPESVGVSARAAERALRAWCLAQPAREGEFRAFWCHSAFGLGGKGWDESVRLLKEGGFNAVLPNMLWAGVAYYPSKTLPEYGGLAQQGDQIAQCLAACRKYGVQCHVWKVNWNTGGKAPKAFLERLRAEGRTQKEYSGALKDEWLCPSHPANQELEVASMLEIVRTYEVDGIHFDYIRYPGNDCCFCDGCRARFEAALGRAVKEWPEDTRRDEAVRQRWLDFRRASIDTVVRRVAEGSRGIRPGVKVSAAVFRNWPVDRDGVGQDWKLWCDEGWLDFVCPMDYFDSNAQFRTVVAAQKGYAGRVPLYPGIGLSCWRDPRDAVRLAQQIGIVRELGVPGYTVFNYDANAEAVLPYLRLGVTAR